MRALPLLVVIALARVAHAEPDVERARQEYDLGYQALQAGKFDEAIVHYQRSYELAPRPRTLFNLAQAEERLGRRDDALAHYTQFVAHAEPRDDAFVGEARRRIDALTPRAQPPAITPPPAPTTDPPIANPIATPARCTSRGGLALVVRANVAGATVSVDGVVVGSTADRDGDGFALRYPVAAGEHAIAIEAGARAWHRRVAGVDDSTVTIDVAFPPPGRAPAWRWVLLGAGVASEAAAATVGVLALRDVATASADRHARGKTRALVADALGVVGVAALIGAWQLHPSAAATATVRATGGTP